MRHKMKLKVMTPQHPKWREFCDRLTSSDGCNFQEDENGKITWRCRGGHDKSFATQILQSYSNIDIKASLQYFDEHGGHCDCEILFNVDR